MTQRLLSSTTSLAACLLAVLLLTSCNDKPEVKWPRKWVAFGPVPKEASLLDPEALSAYSQLPASITVEGVEYPARPVTLDEKGGVDFVKLFGQEPDAGATAYLFAKLDVPSPHPFYAGAGADWWMAWYVDGRPVYDTFRGGNRNSDFAYSNHPFRLKLEKGPHILAATVRSGSGGWKLYTAGGTRYEKELSSVLASRGSEEEERRKLIESIGRDAEANRHMKLVIFGSSVALGTGAEKNHGWAWNLANTLEQRHWTVVNKSVGGDTTTKLLARFKRDLLSERPDAVIIGLSMANEGLAHNKPSAIYLQYRRNLRKLIQLCLDNGITPYVSNCYPNNNYSPELYDIIRKFNEELAFWPVVSFDFMGAVDDGQGHWVEGTFRDAGHPNALGHAEMAATIPPSVFDFVISRPAAPIPSIGHGYLTVDTPGDAAPIWYKPEDPIHSFTYAFRVKLPRSFRNLHLAAVDGGTLATDAKGQFQYLPAGDAEPIRTTVKAQEGESVHLALVHDHLQKTSTLLIDAEPVGTTTEPLTPTAFHLGGSAHSPAKDASFRRMMLYRTAMRPDQVRHLAEGRTPRSSLELYAPLCDTLTGPGGCLINLAPTSALPRASEPYGSTP